MSARIYRRWSVSWRRCSGRIRARWRVDMTTVKLFWSGGFQTVPLPQPFRIEGEEVRIRRQGDAVSWSHWRGTGLGWMR